MFHLFFLSLDALLLNIFLLANMYSIFYSKWLGSAHNCTWVYSHIPSFCVDGFDSKIYIFGKFFHFSSQINKKFFGGVIPRVNDSRRYSSPSFLLDGTASSLPLIFMLAAEQAYLLVHGALLKPTLRWNIP